MSTKPSKLKTADIRKKLKKIPDWRPNPKLTEISKSYQCSNFVASLAFAAKITVHAEVLNHHPMLEISYGKVKVRLSTHDVAGLTNTDIELAEKIDKLTRA